VAKDTAKRKRVMQRSMRLGHCICDPKKPCPCDLLRDEDICLCAGERPEFAAGPVRLTRLVESAGCASKIDRASLKGLLAGLPVPDDPRVLVGMPAGDDAGVFDMGDGRALVQTVDVFSPSVDDPYVFGQVAAANSVSDVYAMGGTPLTALSIVGFPIRMVPDDVLQAILRGGIDKMGEAGVSVIGGHSIKDNELKAGFAVTGVIDPARMMTNGAVRPGDVLVLTKPIGTGIIAFAAQIDRAPEGAIEAAAASMTALNRAAAECMLEVGAHACTDVTGFGLMGHLAEMAASSRVDVEIVWDDIPLLPGVLECAGQGIFSGAVERNRESSGECVTAGEGVDSVMLDVCFDPQTSGGLLIAVREDRAGELLGMLRERGVEAAALVGRATGAGTGRITVTTRGRRTIPIGETVAGAPRADTDQECCMEPVNADDECCAEGHGGPAARAAGTEEASDIEAVFRAFMGAVNKPGALDAYTKQVVSIALSILAKCEPCTKLHVAKARQMGITHQEIDEAAWMAIAFGGSPTKMFYSGIKGD
jgi:selenide,water dikinase